MNKGKPIFFPGLNGLRAIAALAVVVSHTTVELGRFNLDPHLFGVLENGNPRSLDLADFGVTIFFALSGFLITYLLLAEDSQKPINIPNFYIRRILRIWPLYYAYFLIAMTLTVLWSDEYTTGTTLCYIFFAANIPKIISHQIPLLSHYWSLGVEEQFYLLWPLGVKKNINRIIPVTIGIVFLFLALKVFAHLVYPGSYFETTMYIVKFDCMLIGALGAMMHFHKNKLFFWINTHVGTQAVGWFALFLVAINRFHFFSIIDHELISVVSVILIVGQIMAKHKIFNLETNAFDFLGKISYGIYVIHPLVLVVVAKLTSGLSFDIPFFKYLIAYVAVTGITILMAYLSYEYFEKPFLRMKGRFSTVRSAGTKHYTQEEKTKADMEVSASASSSLSPD
ncbi:MAG: acyltransferase [Saprospirales bacterium]|nr:acyltransferase [Saprospirales bacterium]